MKIKQFFATMGATVAIAVTAFAGEADVTQVEVIRTGPGVFRFSVSVLHQDEGWDHYADRWELLAPDGRILATRTLYHPHVDEQPFTRSLNSVKIPADIGQVEVRAHCSVHAYGGKSQTAGLPEK